MLFDGDNVSNTVWFAAKFMNSGEVLSWTTFTKQKTIAGLSTPCSYIAEGTKLEIFLSKKNSFELRPQPFTIVLSGTGRNSGLAAGGGMGSPPP